MVRASCNGKCGRGPGIPRSAHTGVGVTTATGVGRTAPAVAPAGATASAHSVRQRRHRTLRRLLRNRAGVLGGVLVLGIGLAAVLAPLLAPHDPDQVNLVLRTKPPGTPGYLLGTDIYGRDLLSRLIWGGRVSLTMGLAAMALSASIGISLGVLSGYLGGHVDTVVMRVVDVMLAFPYILLAIVIGAAEHHAGHRYRRNRLLCARHARRCREHSRGGLC